MEDGILTTIDNTRVVAARKAGIEIHDLLLEGMSKEKSLVLLGLVSISD